MLYNYRKNYRDLDASLDTGHCGDDFDSYIKLWYKGIPLTEF